MSGTTVRLALILLNGVLLFGQDDTTIRVNVRLVRILATVKDVEVYTTAQFSHMTTFYWMFTTGAGVAVLIAAVLILRRAGQVQKVNIGRMWIRPVFLILLLAGALAAEPFPGLIAMGAFVLAAVAGAALGYYMARHQHLSIHPETGQLESRTSTIGTFLVFGLFAVRFGARLVFPDLANPGHHAGQIPDAINQAGSGATALLSTEIQRDRAGQIRVGPNN